MISLALSDIVNSFYGMVGGEKSNKDFMNEIYETPFIYILLILHVLAGAW